jgi:RNA polymerase sigma factor (sigma-70 family)
MIEAELAATVRAAQSGDAMAMGALLDELMPYVGRICGAVALDKGEDAAQNALIAVLTNLRKLREPEALHAWVRRIATREAVRAAHEPPRGVDPGELAERLPAAGDPQLAIEIRDQLARLEPEQRAVLVLRELEGLAEEEVAALLAVPTGTVKSRLHRARSRFRKGWME